MTALRFRVGEMALLDHPSAPKVIVEVVASGPFKKGEWVLGLMVLSECDYIIHVPQYFFPSTALAHDRWLIKLQDPDQGVDVAEEQEVHA